MDVNKYYLLVVGLFMLFAGCITPAVSPAPSPHNVSLPTSSPTTCAQVQTFAINPNNNLCYSFTTPCDVPEGWKVVSSCPTPTPIVQTVTTTPSPTPTLPLPTSTPTPTPKYGVDDVTMCTSLCISNIKFCSNNVEEDGFCNEIKNPVYSPGDTIYLYHEIGGATTKKINGEYTESITDYLTLYEWRNGQKYAAIGGSIPYIFFQKEGNIGTSKIAKIPVPGHLVISSFEGYWINGLYEIEFKVKDGNSGETRSVSAFFTMKKS